MLSATLRNLTGTTTDEAAWRMIFANYNGRAHGLPKQGYRAGEIVAVKVNLNSSSAKGSGNFVNVSPHFALAMVRQLVNHAHVAPGDILVYDARRDIYPGLLTKIWSEFKDVRFVQQDAPNPTTQQNPGYGGLHGLTKAKWVEGVSYSANNYHNAKLIPQQVKDATYMVNVALLKAHSYPYSATGKMKDKRLSP
jgi:hypothetical protein